MSQKSNHGTYAHTFISIQPRRLRCTVNKEHFTVHQRVIVIKNMNHLKNAFIPVSKRGVILHSYTSKR